MTNCTVNRLSDYNYPGTSWKLLALFWEVLTIPQLYFTVVVAIFSISLNVFLLHRFIFSLLVKTEKRKSPIKTAVVKIHQPFSVRLISDKCTYDQVSIEVCATKDYHLIVLWGASIPLLFQSLCKAKDLSEEMFVCCQKNAIVTNNAHDAKLITFKPAADGPCPNLRSGRRDFYPLVVILSQNSAHFGDSETVSLVTVIHIKDEFFANPSKVMAQYIKVSDGRVFNLRQIFFSASAELDDTGKFQEFCVVCQTLPLNCIVLPCRHACLCTECLPKLDRCPICRSRMKQYFVIDDSRDTQRPDDPHATKSTCSLELSLNSWNYRQ